MSNPTPENEAGHAERLDRLEALLAVRATDSLTEDQRAELAGLMRRVPGASEIAAEVDAVEGGLVGALHAAGEPLPAALRARLAAEGRAMVATGAAESSGSDGFAVDDVPASIPIAGQFARAAGGAVRSARSGALVSRLGWLVAAAAIVLAAAAWWPKGASEDLPPSLSDRRTALAGEDADAITLVLAASDHPAAQSVVADIVWSDARQEGYLRVRGLAMNDPTRQQYQLWIYDATRDDSYPVDGGVFDLTMASIDPVTRDAIIPINAKLAVGRATMFAVTVERPGGVVVPTASGVLLRGVVRAGLG